MVEIQTILTYLTLISIPIGVFYHIMTLNNTRKNQQMQLETRQAQLLMQVYSRWMDYDNQEREYELMTWEWKDFDDFQRKYGAAGNSEAYLTWCTVSCFYEGLGVLVKRGFINPDVVDDLISGWVLRFWEKFGPIVVEVRRQYNNPAAGEYAEYLYNQIKPIWDKQHQKAQPVHTIIPNP